MNDYNANPLPESELEQRLHEILKLQYVKSVMEAGSDNVHRTVAVNRIKALIAQEYARGKQDALNKVREQANGSYEIRTPKEPQYMVWEIAEWQLKAIEKLKEQG